MGNHHRLIKPAAVHGHVMDDAHHAPTWVKVSPFVAMVIGFITAYWFYIVNPELPRKLAEVRSSAFA